MAPAVLRLGDGVLDRLRGAGRELVEADHRHVLAGDHRPADERQVELLADDLDVERRAAVADDRQRDGLALGSADARHDLVGRLVGRGHWPSTAVILSPRLSPAASAGVPGMTDWIVTPLVVSAVELDADADEGAGQRLVGGLQLVRRQEPRVALVADRRDESPDRGVRQVLRVQVLGIDVVVLDRLPRLADEGEVGGAGVARSGGTVRRAGSGAVDEAGVADGDAAREHDDGEHGREDRDRPLRVAAARGGGSGEGAGAGGGTGTTGSTGAAGIAPPAVVVWVEFEGVGHDVPGAWGARGRGHSGQHDASSLQAGCPAGEVALRRGRRGCAPGGVRRGRWVRWVREAGAAPPAAARAVRTGQSGRMLWLAWNTFSGSTRRLTWTRRS